MGFRKWITSFGASARLQHRIQMLELELEAAQLAHKGTQDAYRQAFKEIYAELQDIKREIQWSDVPVDFPLTPEVSNG
ncbi:hypothetical protein G173_gp050 [Erwinia phage phiEaH2]|uniref:Uncharacterized protein n=1 Tax=Erwinia phage phiEaH2 TaxID=1029988 RepID=J7KKG3_9CAUD|nr:hypothetical protein G173_gp050 [Erwinia phage phiEaH2]AFQ96595.1 hypothetical protein [Erwinia phage phiEaH2]